MLRVVGGFEEQFVCPHARHARLQQINAVGGVKVGESAAHRINSARDFAEGIVGVTVELSGAVIERTADLRGKIVGADNGRELSGVAVPYPVLQRLLGAFEDAGTDADGGVQPVEYPGLGVVAVRCGAGVAAPIERVPSEQGIIIEARHPLRHGRARVGIGYPRRTGVEFNPLAAAVGINDFGDDIAGGLSVEAARKEIIGPVRGHQAIEVTAIIVLLSLRTSGDGSGP